MPPRMAGVASSKNIDCHPCMPQHAVERVFMISPLSGAADEAGNRDADEEQGAQTC